MNENLRHQSDGQARLANLPCQGNARRLANVSERSCMKLKYLLLAPAFFLAACDQQSPAQATSATAKSPLIVALESMGSHFQQEPSNVMVNQKVTGESPTEAVVEIEESGLLDDSVFAQKTIFNLSIENERWTVTDKTTQVKCYPGRGHQDYGSDPCQ